MEPRSATPLNEPSVTLTSRSGVSSPRPVEQGRGGYLTAELSASALRHNLRLLRAELPAGTQLCPTVKCDCYGHGIELLLPIFSEMTDGLCVASPDEALAIRAMGYDGRLLVFFSPCADATSDDDPAGTLDKLLAHEVTLTLVDRREVDLVSTAAAELGTTARVHVKINTGMCRSGIAPAEAPGLIGAIRRAAAIELTGLYTHFATADEADKTATRQQLARLIDVAEACDAGSLTLHAANSAALIDLPETHLAMARPGIACYGIAPSNQMHRRLALRPVLRLWARLMQTRQVPAGSRCGYGLTHTFGRDSRIGLVPVGYGDGYLRSLSNRGAVMRVGGVRVAVCGRISMDQVILDLTDAPHVQPGDVVEIISNNPDDPHSMEHLAALAGTIPYELTCRLGQRVRRVLVE